MDIIYLFAWLLFDSNWIPHILAMIFITLYYSKSSLLQTYTKQRDNDTGGLPQQTTLGSGQRQDT